MNQQKWIELIGARQHNLKNVDVKFPKEKLSVVTGPSGSGKSSLAFDTLFAEGQRRYMESLSTYARQFLDKQEKPDIDEIRGISPTIAIEQKNHTKNSRSTVGTATEIYDYLRLVFAKMGTMYSPDSGKPVKRDLVKEVSQQLLRDFRGQRAYMCFPIEFGAKSKVHDRKLVLASLLERGFSRALPDEPRASKTVASPEEVAVPIRKVAKSSSARIETRLSVSVRSRLPTPIGDLTGGVVPPGAEVQFLDIQESLAAKSSDLLGRASTEKKLLLVVDRFSIDDESRGRLEDSLVSAYSEGFGRARVLVLDDESRLLFESRYTEFPSTGDDDRRYPELTPLLFSFNSPMGACEKCKGFGNVLRIDPDLVVPNPMMSISQGAVEPLTKASSRSWLKQLLIFCQKEKISISLAWEKLPDKDRKKIWDGHSDFPGIIGLFEELESEKYKMGVRVFLSRYRSPRICTACKGQRLRPESRNVLFHKLSIGDLTGKSIADLSKWFQALVLSSTEKEIGKDLFPQIIARLEFLLRVGLDYLSLDRLARTLSGGEAQRIALANQLGARLTQTTYVLDEPSIGLHPRDTERLIGIMRDLAALKNTVVVVEHDPDIIRSADYIVDMGPEAGERGGEILFAGPYADFLKKVPEQSLTGRFLTHVESVGVPMRRRLDRFKDRSKKTEWLSVTGCKANNLKGVDLEIPLGTLTCVTGVSGSGKSTAIRRTLYPALAKIFMQRVDEMGPFDKISGFEHIKSVQLIDQEPIGRSPRSNPVTFMKCFDEVRSLFSSTLEARKKHFHAGHFSFNVPGGRCENCEGDGFTRVEMIFMEDIFLKCDICEGKRYKPEVLAIRYNGKNIDDVLGLTVNEAKKFFVGEGRLLVNLGILSQVGLGYLRLGQSSTTLSGGESQRLKIARELAMSDGAGCVYVLDEPTTGLHFRDVKVLLRVLHQLVERGNSVIVIEHNTDVMKSADWIIDFGPDGGDKGGVIVAKGTPEEIVEQKKGHTWRYLKTAIDVSPKISVPELLST